MSSQDKLFHPLMIAPDFQLANRIIVAPCTRGRSGSSRVPNKFMKQYYEMRASSGLIITEATAISDQGYGWFGAPGVYTQEQSDGWKMVVEGVHVKGGKIFLQLWHMGRKSHTSFHPITKEIVAPSAIAIDDGTLVYDSERNKVPHEKPRALEVSEVRAIVKDYQIAAKFAKEAGFDGVEIHSANGYLIDQFLQSVSNIRNDQYGGSVENRYRFLREIVESIGEVYPYSRIGVRFSPNGAFGGMGSLDNDVMFPFVASQLASYGLAYLHIMDGIWRGFHGKCRQLTLYDMKKAFKDGLIIGNVEYTKDTASGAIRTGSIDAASFGSLYLSNPDLVERFKHHYPLNPIPPLEEWFGTAMNPQDCLEGYLTYLPYQMSSAP
jgi:N-ethylmaleimide reductase